MGRHAAPGPPDVKHTEVPQARSATASMQPRQFSASKTGHRSSFSTNNPSFGTQVKQDMQRRQSGHMPSHAKPGRHAKPYDAKADIDKSLGQKKPYKAKHDVLGLDKPAPAKGKVNRNGTGSKPDHKKKTSLIKKVHASKHEGKNRKHIEAMTH